MPSLLPLAFLVLAWADPPAPAPNGLDLVAAVESAVADAVARAEGSVVAIARDKSENDATLAVRGKSPLRDPNFDRRFGALGGINGLEPPGGEALSFDFGSGVVIGDKGQILTAFHVVRGARALHVRAAGRQSFDAEILAADPRIDLAVIAPKEIPGVPAPKLTPVAIGDAGKLRKGSFLIALGNPFNAAMKDGRASASWGILANVARQVEQTPEERVRMEKDLRHFPHFLQMDAKLNLGMSGGAVVNMKGELVGVTTAAANVAGFDAQAGYSIPMDALARNVIAALKEGREYEHGFLGINLDTQYLTNRIMSAAPGTPAAHGGLRVGDAIEAVGETPVNDVDGLVVAINSVPAGESVRLRLRRDGSVIERTVELAKRRPSPQVIATNRPNPWRGLRVDYTSTVVGLGIDRLDALAREGVVITEVETGSDAEKAGLKVGQVISRVGEDAAPVRSPREFARAVKPLKGPVKLETDQGPATVK